ncbi:MAG TPA: gamma carbonic anhydrase family protein [Patescibacteria group bacterium]|nr:gamma carbonic anhydrase family protein [Patescibacteria group bacterium]
MIRSYQGKTPQIAASAWIDPAATIIGDVTLEEDASIWPGAVLRGDVNFIRIGKRTNIQDNSVLHGVTDKFPVILGEAVTVGHGVILHGCTVESRCLIGMGAIILNGARIGTGSIVAAGTLITEGTVIPPASLVMGHPGKVRRTLTDEDLAGIDRYAAHYLARKKAYQEESSGK